MSDDLIKRSDAIAEIYKVRTPDVISHHYAELFINAVRRAPSADRPQGHYIKGRNGEWYCSKCKRIDDKYSVANFCWYCGADMRESEGE